MTILFPNFVIIINLLILLLIKLWILFNIIHQSPHECFPEPASFSEDFQVEHPASMELNLISCPSCVQPDVANSHHAKTLNTTGNSKGSRITEICRRFGNFAHVRAYVKCKRRFSKSPAPQWVLGDVMRCE